MGFRLANIPKYTPEKRDVILDALANNPSLGSAARKGRISRRTLWMWRRDNPDFAAECEAAREQGFEALEDALIARGQKSDTTAAIFMLKSWRPDRYRETTRHEHTGKDGEALTITIAQRPDGPPEQ